MAPPGAAPRTVRVTEAAPLPDPSRRGDQRDCAARCPASEGTPSRRHRAQYSNAPPGPDLGIRPSGPGGAGVARPDLGIRPSGRATPPPGETGGSATDRSPRGPVLPYGLGPHLARRERGTPGAMSRSSQGPPPPLSGMGQPAARSTQHTGRPAVREHPLDPFLTRSPRRPPNPRRGGEETTEPRVGRGVETLNPHGQGANLPLTVPCHRAFEVRAANPYRHTGDPSRRTSPPGVPPTRRGDPLGVPDPVVQTQPP